MNKDALRDAPPEPPVRRRSADRRAGLAGFLILCALIAGGVFLRKAAVRRSAEKETVCFSHFRAGLGHGAGAADALDKAARCFGDLLRDRPFSAETAFRAQAAQDLAALLRNPAAPPRGVGKVMDEEFRKGLDLLLSGELAEAARQFSLNEQVSGPQGALAKRYKVLCEALGAGIAAPPAVK